VSKQGQRNRTGAPGSPQRTWAENDGAQPLRSHLLNPRKSRLDSKSIQPDLSAPVMTQYLSKLVVGAPAFMRGGGAL
jgi:hypothetical protein